MEFENSSGNAEKRKRISVGWNGKLYLQRFASMLEELDKNYMEYLDYWNEKYYRNGFADVIELLS